MSRREIINLLIKKYDIGVFLAVSICEDLAHRELLQKFIEHYEEYPFLEDFMLEFYDKEMIL